MKKYSIYLVYMLFGLFLFGSCSDESIVNKKEVEEGIPVSLKIPYTAPEMDIITTRAGKSDVKLLSDLYVFTFDSYTGEFVSGENVLTEGSNSSTGNISINTTSGYRNIYAVANTVSGMFPDIQTKLQNAISRELKESDFLKLAAELSSNNVENNDDIMLMSGQWSNDDKTKCLIQAGTAALPGTIKIKRVAAKVTFNIKTGSGAKGTFTAKEYQVLRVPSGAKLFENGTAAISSYFDLEDFMPIREGGSFTFYMSENLKQPLNTCYNQNDRELYKEDNNKRKFTNAHQDATYVIVKGSFVGKAEDPTIIDGDKNGSVVAPRVLYIIHLGKGAGSVAREGYDANDFNTYRNTDYTYNLTVNGVDNIVVEVLTNNPDEDNKPREEGDVIFGGDNDVILRCDAHFEQRLLTFTKDKLKDFSFAVKTPYTDKVYKADSEGDYTIANDDDLSWVTFYKNPNNESKCISYTSAKPNGNATNLWTVDKLVKELKKWKVGDDHQDWGDKVHFTCFVNEFYYEDKPKEWYKYVNTGEDRTLQILCETSSQQAGLGSSSVTKNAQYVITQRPIETIYKKTQSVANSIIAWGIETVNETGRLTCGGSKANADHGRKNMDFSGQWDAYLDFNKAPGADGMVNYMNKSGKNVAYYACLQRNRDENGNGKIDPDEVKWYLPSSKQYISLWIGNEAISSEANIYGAEGGDGKVSPDRHFYTSTNGARVYWAEEGYSLGGENGDDNYVSDKDEGRRQYRCVRDLGVTKDQLASSYTLSPIYEKTGNSITLENLSSVSLRTQKAVSELRVHHEREEINKPYNGFSYSDYYKEKNRTVKKNWNTLNEDANNYPANSYCARYKGKGWRLPNQRELGLMYVASIGGPGLCRTYYSGVPYDWKDGTKDDSKVWEGWHWVTHKWSKGTSHTFQYDGNLHLWARGHRGEDHAKSEFRCVKDN